MMKQHLHEAAAFQIKHCKAHHDHTADLFESYDAAPDYMIMLLQHVYLEACRS